MSELDFRTRCLALAEKNGCTVQVLYNPPDEREATFTWTVDGNAYAWNLEWRRAWMIDEYFFIAERGLAEEIAMSRGSAPEPKT